MTGISILLSVLGILKVLMQGNHLRTSKVYDGTLVQHVFPENVDYSQSTLNCLSSGHEKEIEMKRLFCMHDGSTNRFGIYAEVACSILDNGMIIIC